MPKARSKTYKKRSFHGNRYSNSAAKNNATTASESASASKLKAIVSSDDLQTDFKHLKGNRIFDIQTLFRVFAILSCPQCFATGLKLTEDSKEGLSSNFAIVCNCGFMTGFTSSPKENKRCSLNTLLVFGLRLIGRGFSAGKKLLCTFNLPYVCKKTFRRHELKLLDAVKYCSEQNMKAASKEVEILLKRTTCGVSVDGTWQRRGHMSLNGCVSAISINTGKILDLEVLSQYCKACEVKTEGDHACSNYKGSSGNMETVGAFRIFERSLTQRHLKYTEYYGDGDSKAYLNVKDMYGEDSVTKLECIGHVQKRVGSRLRKLKKNVKGLGGKGKLTDKFIDKLQNYYGIAIRSNVGNIDKMQSAVIGAFFHCCSSDTRHMHGQCPTGKESWCRYQRAVAEKKPYMEKPKGLNPSVINVVRNAYEELCDRELLSKCLHGLTQNNNESFNNILWSIIPKETFVQLNTLLVGAHIAAILFNSGYSGLLPVFSYLAIPINDLTLKNYMLIDKERLSKSKRQSLPSTKLSRKKLKAKKKSKLVKNELKEGLTYKYGEF